ncbi:deoxyribodipyrimidine photo-lyase [Rhizobium sp. SG_E_25_P2]|uniref:cryptochrome/photolyase family protein n=1 Tax=Rhizobium sp. SG_E_25_P2 TaxID=2879942 RepID=UPI0024766777|nr:deoxyribodipyrimidine photo-lyase [Rhizobium sp. SG_E_25_P2]MDH6268652.1 deoxyribodipyrimidine photo-lyase [Rhizobium sp. SG_E_25_P2]
MAEKKTGPGPSIVWFRRDLRLSDNPALAAALLAGGDVICIYIREDEEVFAGAHGAAQAWWLHNSLERLSADLVARGNRLLLLTGHAEDALDSLIETTGARAVFWNRRYDLASRDIDAAIKKNLKARGLDARSFDGFLLHDPMALMTGQGKRFSVYSPFWRAFEAQYRPIDAIPAPERIPACAGAAESEDLAAWSLLPNKPDWAGGFRETWTPGEAGAEAALQAFLDEAVKGYKKNRDIPGKKTTSRLSPHLAFGEISPHRIWRATEGLTDAIPAEDIIHFRKELVWREFSWHLLFHVPDLASRNLNRKFDAFPWADNPEGLDLWTRGLTGYPIVDAGMRELWRTGWMHNRVRMIVASFLIKDLLVHWTEGESWFRDTLVDVDLASNAASWQWVAGCGADAAPYFRIFNPVKQGETFDPDGAYVRQYCPELARLPDRYIHRPWEAPADALASAGVTLGDTYPKPVVDHDRARKAALAAYAEITGSNQGDEPQQDNV